MVKMRNNSQHTTECNREKGRWHLVDQSACYLNWFPSIALASIHTTVLWDRNSKRERRVKERYSSSPSIQMGKRETQRANVAFNSYLFLFICGLKTSLAFTLQNHAEVAYCHSNDSPLSSILSPLPFCFPHRHTFKSLTTKIQRSVPFPVFSFLPSPPLPLCMTHLPLFSN